MGIRLRTLPDMGQRLVPFVQDVLVHGEEIQCHEIKAVLMCKLLPVFFSDVPNLTYVDQRSL